MDEPSTDLRNTRARLIKLAIAAAIGGVLTFFTLAAMMSTGRGPSTDPIGASIPALLGFAIFVVTTSLAHRVISRKR
jgi:hypothetical protein